MNAKIDIVIKGTVNGFGQLMATDPSLNSDTVRDIRSAFDQNAGYLGKDGIMLQVGATGIWVSEVMLLTDSFRRAGYACFSIHVPFGVKVPGYELNRVLQDLKTQYSAQLTNYMASNMVNWTFVNNAVAGLNAKAVACSKRLTPMTTPNSFAVLNGVDANAFLNRIYQPEYERYEAVFLGTQLLAQGCNYQVLNIDITNPVFSVVWTGNTPTITRNVVTAVRRNAIATTTQRFERYFHKPLEVKLSEGQVEEGNERVIMQYPAPERFVPETYMVKFNLEQYPGCNATLRDLSTNQIKPISQGMVMLQGDEAGHEYVLKVMAAGYEPYEKRLKELFRAENSSVNVSLRQLAAAGPSRDDEDPFGDYSGYVPPRRHKPTFWEKYKLVVIICIVLLLGGGGAAAWLLLPKGNENTEKTDTGDKGGEKRDTFKQEVQMCLDGDVWKLVSLKNYKDEWLKKELDTTEELYLQLLDHITLRECIDNGSWDQKDREPNTIYHISARKSLNHLGSKQDLPTELWQQLNGLQKANRAKLKNAKDMSLREIKEAVGITTSKSEPEMKEGVEEETVTGTKDTPGVKGQDNSQKSEQAKGQAPNTNQEKAQKKDPQAGPKELSDEQAYIRVKTWEGALKLQKDIKSGAVKVDKSFQSQLASVIDKKTSKEMSDEQYNQTAKNYNNIKDLLRAVS